MKNVLTNPPGSSPLIHTHQPLNAVTQTVRLEPTNNPTVFIGDCRQVLRTLPDQSVHCCVTSPPYWGLRDYQLPPVVWGGDRDCPHEWKEHVRPAANGITHTSGMSGQTLSASSATRTPMLSNFCVHCGAWSGQLGLEPTSDMYVQHLVDVFGEVHRLLRKDGTLWLNLGDSYYGSWGNYVVAESTTAKALDKRRKDRYGTFKPPMAAGRGMEPLKPKDLCGIPWRVALALQTSGWYLRCDIIWAKSNPMPESVKDRPTRAHEYLFLLTKSPQYYYDAKAIKEPCCSGPSGIRKMREGLPRIGGKHKELNDSLASASQHTNIGHRRAVGSLDGRNKRSVWNVATVPYRGAHFATFPSKLIEPCIKAGCPLGGIVCDPFGGSGTTGKVALDLGRRAILIELNLEYRKLIEQRCGIEAGQAGS